jgi:hypothetical protein
MGVSIYAKGNVTVNQMQEDPHYDNPTLTSLNEKRVLAGKIDCQQNSCFQMWDPFQGKYSTTYRGTSYLDSSCFTPQEWATLKSSLNLQNGNPYLLTDKGYYSLYYVDSNDKAWSANGLGFKILDSGREGIVIIDKTDQKFVSNQVCYVYDYKTASTGYINNVSQVPATTTHRIGFISDQFPDRVLSKTDYENSVNALNQYDPNSGRKINRRDSVFRGLIYSCKDFKVNSPENGFKLQGALVAYGSDPDTGNSNGARGDITIEARDISIMHDPKYIGILGGAGDSTVRTLYWASYK